MITSGLADTIAALATVPGRSAIAIVRISGSHALSILARLSADKPAPAPRSQMLLRVRHPVTAESLDQALVTAFPAPNSYTGEDVVEIATHGGLLTPQLVLDAVLAAGARPALAGEFTRRALLNGKMDLLQAEAVVDLIDGRSPALHRAALHQVERGLSRRIEGLRELILRVEALVAYGIDFPEEDEPPVPAERVRGAATDVLGQIDGLLDTVPQGEMLRTGALIVFGGRPNSGKSSLFNALLGLDRSIVTDTPGTTRDAVEADITLGGFPFRLVDTAGLRHTEDHVESIGVEVAHRYLASADVLLLCAETEEEAREIAGDPRLRESNARRIAVRTKSDRRGEEGPRGGDAVSVSVVTGEGLAELSERIVSVAFGGIRVREGLSTIVTSERQKRALRTARTEVQLFLDAFASGMSVTIAAVHLQAAVAALEDLIGVVTPDDVLGAVFSRFCVGK